MSPLKSAYIMIATAVIVATVAPLSAQPLRYEYCTTGFSAYGIFDELPLYDQSGAEIGRTQDLLIDHDGTVHHLEINRGGLLPDAYYFPWADVEIGETWVSALGEGSDQLLDDDGLLVSSADLIGTLVRTSAEQGLTELASSMTFSSISTQLRLLSYGPTSVSGLPASTRYLSTWSPCATQTWPSQDSTCFSMTMKSGILAHFNVDPDRQERAAWRDHRSWSWARNASTSSTATGSNSLPKCVRK